MKRVFSWLLVTVLILSIGIQGKIVSAAEGKENHLEQEKAGGLEEVKETSFPAELSMYYDDHLDMSGKEIEIVDAGTPDSFQVGYGVEEGTPDEAVLRLDGETLVAVGTGSAKINVDGQECVVTVTAAPISLFLLIGQSNMEGIDGEPTQSIACQNGEVYSSYGEHLVMNRYTATYFAPSALAGTHKTINVNGSTDYLCDYPVNSLSEAGTGKKGPDSGIAYEWNKITGEKVWIVNAAHSGARIQTFQPFNANYEEAVKLFSECQKTLKNEIAAGHYQFSHMGYFWCQGCSDAQYPADWYTVKFLTMHEKLKSDLSIDFDNDPETPENTLEFADIILALDGWNEKGYRTGIYTETMPAEYYSTWRELEMRGHRVAQLWMAANPELPDINIVCNLGDTWMTMPDGTDGVEDYFASHYKDGRVDYPTQEPQPDEWRSPKTAWEVKDSIHYNQIGYNEIGIEAARNACILLDYLEDSEEATTMRLVNWTGFEAATLAIPSVYGQSGTLVVPIVSPIYRAKEISFEITEGLKYEYYDLLTANYNIKEGTLMVKCGNQPAQIVSIENP